jgi:hypothetical protein
METVREFTDNPRFPGIPCERCGLVSLSKFQSCEHRPGGACPYVLREMALRPASLPGILMIVMGVLFLLAFGSMPFLLYPKEDADLGSLIAGILVLTFAFTIANIFVLVGAAFAGLRKSLFHNKAQSRYVETYTIFGLPLAHRLITLGDAVPLEVRAPPLPLSLAGFLMDRPLPVIPSTDLAPPLEIESKALNKLKSINAQLDQGIANALVGAVVHLVARSCVVFRSASHGIFSKWYTTPSLDTYYIEAGEGRSDDLGLLEADLLNKVLNWRSQEWKVEDTVAPTFPDLIKTFQDSDGDFSAYQIRKLLLTDGESRRVFNKRSEGLLGKLMPKIEPTAEAGGKIREAQEVLEDAARRLSREQPGLGNSISLALKKTVFRKHGKVSDPVEKQNAALRRKLLYYVIGISFALALALCWTAAS